MEGLVKSAPLFLAHSSDDPDRIAPQTLKEHACCVAELAARHASHFGAASLARACGLLHDLGKYSIPFQNRLAGKGGKVDHSTWGARQALDTYGSPGYLLAYGIAGHHAGLANGSGSQGTRRALSERLSDESLPALDEAWKHELTLPALASIQEEVGKLRKSASRNFSVHFLVRMLFSALVDADFLDTERYYDQFAQAHRQHATTRATPTPSLEVLRSALDGYMAGFSSATEVNRIRADILSHARRQSALEPGVFSLNVPTGGGKTLASLAFALDHAIWHGQRRIIFVIPFTSIVEQNAAVFRKALGEFGERAVLEHHSAFSQPEPDRLDPDRYQAQAKLRLSMENWDAPIVVTTAVQFMESLFSAKPSQCRKLHNISNSVVILDEAQTIPLKVLRPAVAALKELATNYRCSVVLCTATQPALAAPRAGGSDGGFSGGFENVRSLVEDERKLSKSLERVCVRHVGVLDDEQLGRYMRDREQILCIVNNRLHARAVYRAMKDMAGAVHLSTLMCARHRSAVLAQVRALLAANLPCRVVSTSLIEAGVDVSFPMVMRAEAGLDSIAQAAGRCNRNKEWAVEASKVLVFANENPDWAPPPELLQFAQVAQEVLRKHGSDPLGPDAIHDYFSTLYWQKGDAALDARAILGLIADARPESLPMETVAERFRMIESTQLPVIVGWDEIARDTIRALRHAESGAGLARKLQPYIVQVPRKAHETLRYAGAIQPIAPERWGEQFMELVNMSLYSEESGLWWEEPSFMDAAGLVV